MGSSFENLRQPQHWLNKRGLCLSLCSLHSLTACSSGIGSVFGMGLHVLPLVKIAFTLTDVSVQGCVGQGFVVLKG